VNKGQFATFPGQPCRKGGTLEESQCAKIFS
jgi:hypothetical protein